MDYFSKNLLAGIEFNEEILKEIRKIGEKNEDIINNILKKEQSKKDERSSMSIVEAEKNLKIAGNEVKSIEILEPEKLTEQFNEFLENLEFPESVLDYIKNNKWISIPYKNIYFNKEIMACYPNFKNNFQKIRNGKPDYDQGLQWIKSNAEYKKYNIPWDIPRFNEVDKSFEHETTPISNGAHDIEGNWYYIYKDANNITKVTGNNSDGLVIPIFRMGRKEDHEAFNTKSTPFNYSPKTITVLFILNDLIPDFGNKEIQKEYKEIYDNVQRYKKYISDFELDENKNIISKFRLNKVAKEIAAGDSKKLFGKNRLKFTLENGESIEIEFDRGEIKTGEYTYRNGDKETCIYKRDENKDLYRDDMSTVKMANGDKEVRKYENGVLQGNSFYTYANGERETRTYVDGKLQGDAVLYLANGEESKRYRYEDNEKRDITAAHMMLNVDKIRVNLNPYDENILTDPNRGHWDLFEKDTNEVASGLGKTVYGRDPRKDIKRGGIVGIDFGTKSTVVVFQDDNNRTIPMRISGENLYLDVNDKDYENPTVIEFLDIEKFMKSYNEKAGRPDTRWENVIVSYTAFNHLLNGTSEEFSNTLSDLKQWAGSQNDTIVVKDKKGVEKILPPYMELEEGDIDPVELYAYYIGNYINNMRNGIYLEYFLSFPVTYEKKIREKILQSFERGIKKSLPEFILNDDDIMKKFKVRHGANEPAAYAVCALQEYGFEPDEDETVHYGVFDFGGGTADFDFGIWKPAEDERSFDYELTHFGAGGDRYLGGENILKELAYTVLKKQENLKVLKQEKISFARPEWCERFPGDEVVVDNSPEAKLNVRIIMEKLRPLWESSQDNHFKEEKIKANLYAKDGSVKNGTELEIPQEKLEEFIENKIERGIENFFIAMKKAMKNETVDKINIFLAGNSCKHPKVMELFEKHKEDFDAEIEIFPALGTEEAYEKMKERNIEVNPEDKTNPTGKTGVAYGIIDSRAGGRIDIKNRDEESNIDNEINFKYYVGYEGRKKLKVVLGPQTQYEQFVYYVNVTADVFDLYYSSLPEAMESKMPIVKAVRKRVELDDEYPGAKIYIKAVTPDTLKYVVTQKDIEEKEYLEEGEIKLD